MGLENYLPISLVHLTIGILRFDTHTHTSIHALSTDVDPLPWTPKTLTWMWPGLWALRMWPGLWALRQVQYPLDKHTPMVEADGNLSRALISGVVPSQPIPGWTFPPVTVTGDGSDGQRLPEGFQDQENLFWQGLCKRIIQVELFLVLMIIFT